LFYLWPFAVENAETHRVPDSPGRGNDGLPQYAFLFRAQPQDCIPAVRRQEGAIHVDSISDRRFVRSMFINPVPPMTGPEFFSFVAKATDSLRSRSVRVFSTILSGNAPRSSLRIQRNISTASFATSRLIGTRRTIVPSSVIGGTMFMWEAVSGMVEMLSCILFPRLASER
jgi:hypothetical protein